MTGEVRESAARGAGARVAGVVVAGVVVAGLTIVAIVAGSHGRQTAFVSPDAMVRVSWSARPERIEVCERVSDEELANTPVHMRRQLKCEGTTARYRLEVDHDGVLVDSITVRGGGLRHDREVYVAREIRVTPGSGRLAVRFIRVDSSSSPAAADTAVRENSGLPTGVGKAGAAQDSAAQDSAASSGLADRTVREGEERDRRLAEAIPPILSLDTVVTLASRSVILVTYDPILRRLVTKTGAP